MSKTGKIRLCAALLVLNLLFIWGNSLLPGAISGTISQWLRQLLGFLDNQPDTGHGILRKLAHFTEFACLGVLLQWLRAMLGKKLPGSILLGFGAACIDEIIQCFVPDRGPGILDVAIDTAGVAVGAIILYIIMKNINTRRMNNEKSNCNDSGSGYGSGHGCLRR